MKLFLASSGLEYIKTFVGREAEKTKLLFIPTAGNLDEDVWWIDKDRDVLHKMGFQIAELDIESASEDEMKSQLAATDIVYVAGGNTFHFLKQLRVTGFDKLLDDYVRNGGLYAGASAGALIAGPDIGAISSIDEPEKVTGLESTKGMGWVEVVPIPHYDMKARTQSIDEIKAKYSDKFEMVLLTDDQALLVEDSEWKVIDSPRSELEHEWFNKSHEE
ncbi:MAG: Type 1 glutamine amidotransferase-like domain-containing protein [Candidatus Saccharimonadales bacterium]